MVTKIGTYANAGLVESMDLTVTNKGLKMIEETHEPGTLRPLFNKKGISMPPT